MNRRSRRELLDARAWDMVIDLAAATAAPEALRLRATALINDADRAECQAGGEQMPGGGRG